MLQAHIVTLVSRCGCRLLLAKRCNTAGLLKRQRSTSQICRAKAGQAVWNSKSHAAETGPELVDFNDGHSGFCTPTPANPATNTSSRRPDASNAGLLDLAWWLELRLLEAVHRRHFGASPIACEWIVSSQAAQLQPV